MADYYMQETSMYKSCNSHRLYASLIYIQIRKTGTFEIMKKNSPFLN